MATFTSNTTGNWNASATWNKAGDPPVEGTDYPGAGDTVVIASGHTVTIPAGTWPSSGGYGAITVNSGGILTQSNNAYVAQAGDVLFTVSSGGTFNAGSVGSGITGSLTQTPSSDGGAGYSFAGTVTIVGLTKDHYKLLAADCGEWAASGDIATVANVTAITLAEAPTGWLENDLLVIAPTGRTYSHWDTCLINETPVAGTEITVDGWQGTAPTYTDGVATKSAWNHQGTGSPTQARAEVLNLTRSFKIYSTDSTKQTYISVGATATVRMDYVEVYSFGHTDSAKRGLTCNLSTGTFSSTGLSLHNSNYRGIDITNSSGMTTGTIAITNGIAWTIAGTSAHGVTVAALPLTTGSVTLTSFIAGNITGTTSYGFNILDVGSTFPGCRAVGNVAEGIRIGEVGAAAIDGLADSVVAHSNGGVGVLLGAYFDSTTDVNAPISWRNTGGGFSGVSTRSKVWITSPVAFGNLVGDVAMTTTIGGAWFVLTTPNFTEDSLAGAAGIVVAEATHGTFDITGGTINGAINPLAERGASVNNTTWTNFAAPTFVAADTAFGPYLLSFRHNATEDDHRGYFKYGSVLSNATTRHTASGLSWQHNPTGGTTTWFRVPSSSPFVYQVAANADEEIIISTWVYVDASWNGNASYKPRIVILGGILQGVASDVIGDSHSGAQQWEQLTATCTPTETGLLQVVVEAGGTAGSYYVDDLGVA